MAKIGQQPPPRAPLWPWGGPRSVRDKLVNQAQFDRKARKKGDPKNPALASAALMDSISPAHSAEELRLPMPPTPEGHDADIEGYADGQYLSSAAERMSEERRGQMDRGLSALKAPPERVDRLKSLLQREAQMLELCGNVSNDKAEVERRRREEQSAEGY